MGGRLSYLAFEEFIGAYIQTGVEGTKGVPCAVSWCAVLSSSPVSEAWWLHHGIFSTRDFHIGLLSGHLMTFSEMLKKFVLGSTAISWWTGGFVMSFMTVEGGYLLGHFRRQVSLASLLIVLPLLQRSFGRMGAWVPSSCMV